MKKLLFTLMGSLLLAFAYGQTHVSGGIWANTTWTLLNSPYIVDTTVVVLPGYILTIEPGVTVKFANSQGIEIRQAELIAMGTVTDSITFTCNSTSPSPGIYGGINLNGGNMHSKFGYCNFYYAHIAAQCSVTDTGFTVKHCRLMYNVEGIACQAFNSLIDSCEMKYNTDWAVGGFKKVTNCNISNNNYGVYQCWDVDNCVIDSNTNVGVYENYGSISNSFVRYNNTGFSLLGGPVRIINNCIITYNQIGVDLFNMNTVINCVIDSNSIGINNYDNMGGNNYVANCIIEYNDTGIYESSHNGYTSSGNSFTKNNINNNYLGIFYHSPAPLDTFYCNTICNNVTYGFKYYCAQNTSCVQHNYWCTPDSASTEAIIYDVYDNLSDGFVYFMPIDSACSAVIATSVNETSDENLTEVFPNPAKDNFTIRTVFKNARVDIFDMIGEQVFGVQLNSNYETLNTNFPAGIYFVIITAGVKHVVKKLIVD